MSIRRESTGSLIPFAKEHMTDSFSTVTNLAYLFVAVLVWEINTLVSITFATLFVVSTGFHWTRSGCWHRADIIGIFYAFGAIAGHLWLDALGTIFGVILAATLHYFYDRLNYRVVIGLLWFLCIVPFSLTHDAIDIFYAVGPFVYALLLGQLAEAQIAEEDGIVYDAMHGFWHIFTALGMYYLMTL